MPQQSLSFIISPAEMTAIILPGAGERTVQTDSPPEGDEVRVQADVVDHPVGEGHLADGDVLAGAERILDGQILKLLVEKSAKKKEKKNIAFWSNYEMQRLQFASHTHFSGSSPRDNFWKCCSLPPSSPAPAPAAAAARRPQRPTSDEEKCKRKAQFGASGREKLSINFLFHSCARETFSLLLDAKTIRGEENALEMIGFSLLAPPFLSLAPEGVA